LIKLDSGFSPIWEKQYGLAHYDDIACKLYVDSTGYYLAGTYNNYNQISANFVAKPEIYKTDTAGVVQWRWQSATSRLSTSVCDLIHTQDGGFVYCGTGYGYEVSAGGGGVILEIGWIEKIDRNLHSVWTDTVGPEHGSDLVPISKVAELPDGSIVAAGWLYGSFTQPIPPNPFHNFGFLIKYRYDGSVAWRRLYTHDNDTLISTVSDMKPTDDGGFVLAGKSDDPYLLYGPNHYESWILKVDSCGCMAADDPQCQPARVEELASKGGIALYPNPATDVLYLEAPQGFTGFAFTLTNMLGHEVLTHQATNQRERLPLPELPAGVYLYRITIAGQGVQTGRLVKY